MLIAAKINGLCHHQFCQYSELQYWEAISDPMDCWDRTTIDGTTWMRI